ncbi:MAG TPA: glycosyltransferase family 39 protein [Solirubrobacteraceae bacterium]|nr:glycosyltransferase family 39 protein [Solirubrobacteraceae bacterium]
MSTADHLRRTLLRASAGPAAPPRPEAATAEIAERRVELVEPYAWETSRRARGRWRWWLALAALLAGALALRLWGIRQGLPFAYNTDENSHFVPHALAFFNSDFNPHYFNNPPAFTYLLYAVFSVWFGGRAAVHTFAANPGEVFLVARVTAAVLGTFAVWLLYLAGSRLLDRRVGLLAAALVSVAFLPVFYSHLALNDVPVLAPLTLSLVGTARVLRLGRPLDYLLAGVGLGVACATKYTAGIVLAPLLAAAAVQFMAPGGRRLALAGVGIAAAAAVASFLIANPYAIGDFQTFKGGLSHQSSVAGAEAGKLGLTQHSGLAYYLWSFTWGLGWVPALAAVAGMILLWRDERRLVALLAPAPILFLIFMGSQGRYFGRWLMPVFPIVCILAAYAVVEIADRISVRRPRLRPTMLAVGAVALCGQGLVYSIHSGLVLSRADTRNLTRDWMVSHVPIGSKIVVEPVVPNGWTSDIGPPSSITGNGLRWNKFPTSSTNVDSSGHLRLGAGRVVNIEDYERVLQPGLVSLYERNGYCWVVSGSTQSGRAQAAPRQVPLAIVYYRRLARAQVAYQASPFGAGAHPVPFNFDWSFDYYPLAYHRPGPVMTVYHLAGGVCAHS